MVKWMSRVASNKGKSLLPSTLITLVIVVMLLISGPAQAVAVVISGIQDSYTKGNDIDFQVRIELNDPDQYVPISNLSLDLTGPINKKIFFTLDGKRISGDCNIRIKPVSIPKNDFGYGSGYGYDNRTGYGYDFGKGYGYGYGYGAGGEKISFIYNVTIDTDSKCLPAGNYSVVATLNTGKNVAFQSQSFKFSLLPAAPGQIIKAKVDIKPETINLASKGKFTAFITLPEKFDVRDIDVGSVVIEGAHAVKSMISKENGGTLIAKFNIQHLVKVPTGDSVRLTVKGTLLDGTPFEGSDTVMVINQGKGQKEVEECECDDHAEEHDHDDECDDNVKGHDHEDDKVKEHDHDDESDDNVKEHDHKEKKAKDQKLEKNKDNDQKNKNNGGQAGNNIEYNNNIYIINNSGTVNVNINEGSGTANQGGNNNNNANGNKKGNQGNNNQRGNNGKGNNGKSKK